MQIDDRFKYLWDYALDHMNNYDFEYYLKVTDFGKPRYKNKWDVIKKCSFSSYYGTSSRGFGSVFFEPTRLRLVLDSDEELIIPIEECKKAFENQGKQIIIQERLF